MEFKEYWQTGARELIFSKRAEELERLHNNFQDERVLAIPSCLNEQALTELRTYFDGIGPGFEDIDQYDPSSADIQKRSHDFTQKHPFVKGLLHDETFINFLREVTGIKTLRSHKSNISIRRKTVETPEWHYDGREVTVILPLNAPKAGQGGEIGYYAKVRPPQSSKLQRAIAKACVKLGLHRIFRKMNRLRYVPGHMIIFDGDTTLHRAMPLKEETLRRSIITFYSA